MIHTDAERFTLHTGDAGETAWDLEPGSVQTIVTSPPYFGLRDYASKDQLGQEGDVASYVAALVGVLEELQGALAEDGTLWLNLGDCYGSNKSLMGVPWRVALALMDRGWILRSEIIWAKPNPTPENVRDRPTKSHEQMFLFSRGPRYFYDAEAVREQGSGRAPGNRRHKYADAALLDPSGQHRTKGGLAALADTVYDTRNRRDVWTIASSPFSAAHFATFPPALAEVCVLAGSRVGDTVLDPFSGSSTTGMVALGAGRRYVGIDTNPEYHDLALRTRLEAFA